jgi:hypothetical protein
MLKVKPADQYTAEEMEQMLAAGGKLIGTYPAQAAIHLLTFTELPGRRDFAALVDVEEVPDHDGRPVLAAFVRDWAILAEGPAISYRTGGDARMLALAASLASGQRVDLRDNVGVGGHAHARRVIEAFAIATGVADLYAVTPTPALEERLAQFGALFSN